MPIDAQLVLILVGIVAFSLVSRAATSRWLSAPLAFVAFGLLAGNTGLGWIDIDPGAEGIRLLAEATLGLVLFADASRIDVRALRENAGLPLRLLGVGMPLTIAIGTVLAVLLFPEWTVWEAALAAAILAPTDAALGQAVVSSELVPQKIRQALNVESGLNDGIALPVVLILLALGTNAGGGAGEWLGFWVGQVTLGPLVGAGIGAVGGALLYQAAQRDLAEGAFLKIGALAVAALCYLGAEQVGGNGFMATFVGGMAFGTTSRSTCQVVHEFLEVEGQLLMLAVFLLLGCALAGPALAASTVACLVYAALSLTLARMAPVSVSLIGTGAARWTHLFLGWFGPRGLASVLFGMLLIDEHGPEHGDQVFTVVVLTALGSVVLHGISANWGARSYGAWAAGMEPAMEHEPVAAHPTR